MLAARIAYWAFALSALLIGLLALRFLIAPFALVMAHMAHYLEGFTLPLFAHIVFGPLALMLAPVQLSERLRRARPRLHRASGYVYMVSVAISATGALGLLPHFLGSAWAGTGFALLALAWLYTTARGLLAARSRDFAAHRRWMLRSVALTFAAVTLRLYMAPMMAFGMSVTDTYEITAWAAWVPNILAVEWWLARRRAALAA